MSSTTISLPDDLTARISAAAERTGKSTHTLILEAISEKVELEESRLEFGDEANARMAKIAATGMTIAWSELRPYLEERATGQPSLPPKPTDRRR